MTADEALRVGRRVREGEWHFPYPPEVVFEGAMGALAEMGFRVDHDSPGQGRIVARPGPDRGTGRGYLDLRLIGMTGETFVHVRTGGEGPSSRSSAGEARGELMSRLDRWLRERADVR